MAIENIYQIAIAIIGAFGGSGAILLALSSYLGKIWANRMHLDYRAKLDQELETLKKEHKTEIESYKTELEKAREDYNRYSSKKFLIIEETWNAMFEISNELDSIPFNKKNYIKYLEDKLKIILKYDQLIRKNSLYFNKDIENLLMQYILINSELVACIAEHTKNFDENQIPYIAKEVQEQSQKRLKKLEEIKIKLKEELNFN